MPSPIFVKAKTVTGEVEAVNNFEALYLTIEQPPNSVGYYDVKVKAVRVSGSGEEGDYIIVNQRYSIRRIGNLFQVNQNGTTYSDLFLRNPQPYYGFRFQEDHIHFTAKFFIQTPPDSRYHVMAESTGEVYTILEG